MDVVAVGLDGNVWHMSSTNGGTTRSWDSQGNPGVSYYNQAEAASWGPNSLDIFIIGADYNLYHKRWSGSWGSWQNWGHPAGVSTIWGVSATSGMLNVASSWSRQLDVFVVGGNGSLYYATSLNGSTVQSWTDVGDLGTGGGLGFGTGSTAYGPAWVSAFSTAPNGSVLHAYKANATSSWAYENWGQPSGTNLYNEDIGAATVDPGWLAIDAYASGAAQEKGWYVFNQGSWVNAGSPSIGLDDWVELSTW